MTITMERRLTTIMAADIVGYSLQMGASEDETIERLGVVARIIDHHVRDRGGRVFSQAGDGFLSEFSSPISAVRAGFEIQRVLHAQGKEMKDPPQLRIGIHLADVVVEGENLLGDGVNIASRVETVTNPGSVFITQTVFDQVKRTAQLTFENRGAQELKNISEPIVLYKVIGELGNHSYSTGTLGELSSTAIADAPQTAANSIAVLPFTNMSADPDQEYFADGFCEDLITELARFRDLFVLSRNASFAFKGRHVDVRQVGDDLGVSYFLEGSVRKMGARVRINAQLIETQSGNHIWAEKYDFGVDELFDVQDNLAASIVAMVAGRLSRLAEVAAKRKMPKDMAAYDCMMRGLEHFRLGGVTRESAEEALRWFDAAIEKDPTFGRANALQACALAALAEWTGEDKWDAIHESGRKGIEFDDEDAECHRIMASLSLYTRAYEKAKYHYEKALQLNPNHAYIVGRIGELYNFLGEPEKALEYQLRARQLDPFLPVYCRELEVVANYLLGRYDETLNVVSQLPRLTRRAAAYGAAAATHIESEDARNETARQLLVIDPQFTIDNFLKTEFYKNRALRDQLKEDLMSAGFPKR